MAKEQDLKLEGQEGEEEQSGGGKKKLIIIIGIVVVVLLAGGGAAAFFLLGGEDEEATDEEVVEEVVEEPEIPAVYVKLKPEFVISFQNFLYNSRIESNEMLSLFLALGKPH